MLKKYILGGLGIALGLSLLSYFLLTLDWQVFGEIFKKLNYLSLLGVVFLLALSTLFRALRIEQLLKPSIAIPISYPVRVARCWHALCVGYFGNFVFPARAGEVLRIFQLHKTLKIDLANAMAMAVVDRLFDVWCLLLLGGAVVVTIFSHMSSLHSALFPMMVVALVTFAGVVITFCWPNTIYKFICFLLRPLPSNIQQKLQNFINQALDAMQKIGSMAILSRALFFSICAFIVDAIICYQLFTAFGWDLPFEAALIMELSLCLASSLPAAPGYLGLYQAAAVFVLVPFGYSQEDGVAYALVFQAVSFILYATMGSGGFFSLRKKKNAQST